MLSLYIIRLFALVALFCFVIGNPAPLLEKADKVLVRSEASTDGNIAERELQPPTKCNNKGKATQGRLEFRNNCDPRFSKGIMSSRECVAVGGKTYLCVMGKTVICHGAEVDRLDMVGGECFF